MEITLDILVKYAKVAIPIILVILTGVTSLCVFFLTRYITKRDEFEAAAHKRFEDQEKETKGFFTAQSKEIKEYADKMSERAESVRSDTLSIRKTQLDFQEKTHIELLNIRRASLEFTKQIRDAMNGSQEISMRLSVALKRLEACQSRDEVHDKAIRGILEAMRALKAEIDAMPEQMKSTIAEIAPDLFRVGETKGPRKV